VKSDIQNFSTFYDLNTRCPVGFQKQLLFKVLIGHTATLLSQHHTSIGKKAFDGCQVGIAELYFMNIFLIVANL